MELRIHKSWDMPTSQILNFRPGHPSNSLTHVGIGLLEITASTFIRKVKDLDVSSLRDHYYFIKTVDEETYLDRKLIKNSI